MERCPHCKKTFVRHQCINDSPVQPEDGDYGVCFYCGGWWELHGKRMVEYLPTAEEMQQAIPKMREYGS